MPQAWILDRLQRNQPATEWRVALWADVNTPERRRWYAKPLTWTSAFKDATSQHLQDLRAGIMTEKVITLSYTDAVTFAQVRLDIQEQLNAFQSLTNNLNLWNRYGSHFDGTTWDVIATNP